MSIESEHADMAARLKAIHQIVTGGSIPGMVAGTPVLRPSTPGCNCDADGNPNPEAHALGCPISPVMRPARLGSL